VLIVGGGPAGCAAAMLLTRWGHTATLLTKPLHETVPLGESVPPSTRKLFDVLGIRSQIEAAGFVRSTGNTVWWGSDAPRNEYFPDHTHGWQVTTIALESLLRHAARQAGVRIREERADAARLANVQAEFILDCTGRTGVYARARRLRERDGPHQTVAMVALWSAASFDTPEPTHTLIESYDGGWAWSVPVSTELRYVAAMIDPRTSNLTRAAASRTIYLAEIEKTRQMRRILRDAAIVDGPRGWDATMYHATRYVDDNVLLVGDAGAFIDPLSSAGIKKALASGWLAAVATHTALVDPSRRGIALDFYAEREREVHAAFLRLTHRYWQDAAGAHAHPFWLDRGSDQEAPSDNGMLTETYERIRTAPALRLRTNQEARVEERPAVSGAEIVLERRLVRDDVPGGVRFAKDVDLLALGELAPACESVPELFSAYNARHAPVAMPDFLSALTAAIAQRWLLWCDTY
jgi:flavin-dependent dehydrogenase